MEFIAGRFCGELRAQLPHVSDDIRIIHYWYLPRHLFGGLPSEFNVLFGFKEVESRFEMRSGAASAHSRGG